MRSQPAEPDQTTPNDRAANDAGAAPVRGGGGLLRTLVSGGVIVALVIALTLWVGRPAPTPASFGAANLADAIAQAGDERPVVAVFSASWCPPCRSYKRDALADADVTAWLDANAVPVLVDIDEDPEAARAAGVTSIPTTAIFRNGEIVARRVGAASADDLLAWLEDGATR